MSPLPASKTFLESKTPPAYVNPDEYLPVSGELKFSRTHLHNLESLLMRSPYLAPKMKEALHQIEKELNSPEIFHSNSSIETSYKPSETNESNFVTPSPSFKS